MPTDTTHLAKLVQELADRAELIDLEARKGRNADERRYDEIADIRTEDSVSFFRNGELRLEGVDAIKAQSQQNLSKFDRIHHLITNILVDVQGDTAQIRANVIATHVYDAADPTGVWVVKGYYLDEAVRTPDGWRLSKTALHRIWEHDTRKGPDLSPEVLGT